MSYIIIEMQYLPEMLGLCKKCIWLII